MASTKRLSCSGLIHTNLITTRASLVSYGSQQNNYPASMLLSPIRSEKWRSANASADVELVFDLKAAYHPTVVAFVNPNFMTLGGVFTGAYVRCTLADNNLLNSGAIYWDVPSIPVAAPNNIAVHYLDTPTSGSYLSNTTKRYFGMKLFGAQVYSELTLSYFELGALFLGSHIETPIDPSSDFSLKVDAIKSKARSGATYTDEQSPYSEGSVSIPLADLTTEVQPLRAAIVAAGSGGRVIVDMGAMRTDTTQRAIDAYYGTLDPSNLLQQKIDHATRRSLSFDFIEDNG